MSEFRRIYEGASDQASAAAGAETADAYVTGVEEAIDQAGDLLLRTAKRFENLKVDYTKGHLALIARSTLSSAMSDGGMNPPGLTAEPSDARGARCP